MIFEKIREKITERLEEEKQRFRKLKNDTITLFDSEVIAIKEQSYNFCKEIVNQVEAEYNNGWIPCSERLPEDNETVIFTAEEGVVDAGQYEAKTNWCVNDSYFPNAFSFIAWQPLPEPYKKGE